MFTWITIIYTCLHIIGSLFTLLDHFFHINEFPALLIVRFYNKFGFTHEKKTKKQNKIKPLIIPQMLQYPQKS